MNNKKLSISDLINGVMTFSIGIEKLRECASNNTVMVLSLAQHPSLQTRKLHKKSGNQYLAHQCQIL